MFELKGKRIVSIDQLEFNTMYIVDDEPYKLVFIGKNRYVFRCPTGMEYMNRAMVENRIKEGIFQLNEEITCNA